MNITEQIDQIENEDELRKIRQYADDRLQKVKEIHEQNSVEELRKKYKDKYLLIYGRDFSTTVSTQNKNDIKIVHVIDIAFQGHGFIRCLAKVIHIEYDTESNFLQHLTSSEMAQVNVSYFEDSSYDFKEHEIEKIITANEVNGIIQEAKDHQKMIFDSWDI
jgi:hypothetical protein